MLSESRKSVTIRINVGKTLKASAFSVYSDVSMMTSASAIFSESRISSTQGATGTIIRTTRMTEAPATQIWALDAIRSITVGVGGFAGGDATAAIGSPSLP